MTTKEAIQILLPLLTDEVIICTTGQAMGSDSATKIFSSPKEFC